ncbi:hypothetical protein [Arthrobacter sp. JCM 19049]|uniref:hypothetical protein n=1 Tax=Arthrobacter sp. JCM 19049 TaxID=1460643 RepID=UPI0006D12052|nr:hypothetical protein [Arthrobacter sp. JCM 19049]
MVSIFSPKATRARSADWVELSVLIENRPMTNGRIVSAQRILIENGDEGEILEQDDLDEAVGIDYDNDVQMADNSAEERCQIILEELESRSHALGDMYPFEIVKRYGGWSLQRREGELRHIVAAQKSYLACLLMTCARTELLEFDRNSDLVQRIGNAFQALAFVNAAELVGGEAYWMGSPRPDKSTMLDAISRLSKKMGLGTPHDTRPPGISSANAVKDGGVDIVAWRTFRDGRPSGIVLYGQVASGEDWRSKSIQGNIGDFKTYFKDLPAERPLLAMFMPRVANDHVREDSVYSYEDSVNAEITKHDGELGLIVDRLRLTELTVNSADRQVTRTEKSDIAFAQLWSGHSEQ